MSKINDHEFRIDWDLHELGPRVPQQEHVAHGPRDPVRLLFALAVAHGDVPANAPNLEDEAA
ncbi:MAG: hypothetical protein ACRES8_04265 [Nevskiaceae bacterium]